MTAIEWKKIDGEIFGGEWETSEPCEFNGGVSVAYHEVTGQPLCLVWWGNRRGCLETTHWAELPAPPAGARMPRYGRD